MVISYLTGSDSFRSLARALPGGSARAYAPAAFQGYLIAALGREVWPAESLLVVAPGAAEASRLSQDLAAFAAGIPVWLLPPRGVIYGSGLIPPQLSTGRRHRAMAALAGTGPVIIATDVTALQERELLPGRRGEPLMVRKGAAPAFRQVIDRLAALGYERVDQVEERGQFAVRGGIIDCFPSTDATPLRMEYWGDELEALRRFSPYTQRSLSGAEDADIFAAAAPEGEAPGEASTERGQRRQEAGTGLLASPDFTAKVVLVDPSFFSETAEALWEDARESLAEQAGCRYLDPARVRQQLESRAAVTLESLASGQPYAFSASAFSHVSRRRDDAGDRLDHLVADGFRVFIHFSTRGAAERAGHKLAGHAELREQGEPAPSQPGAWLMAAPAPAGFVSRELKLAVMGERALLRPGRAARSRAAVRGGKGLASFRELSPGNFIVHQDHGIGVFRSVETKTVSGVTRDYLHLSYKGGDALFVPQEQVHKVARYVGTQENAPPLNKLGGKAWALARARARSAAREMAGELLQLYAARQSLSGHAYEPDGRWQAQLEEAFPYSETPDQAAAIEDVKDDMESPHPMDRLICGDVGFGKTEVAIRAAFKAASQGKQVLMLVPTTILALQHYETFRGRFEPYPVVVEMISRFRSQAEGRRIAASFREGKIDVIIGTHRLLSSDIIPHDLGLVIVDEEQRFGVAQKERLRQLRLKVDVLSMTATPIPRTMQMSLSGVRDISVIETPPAGRNPIRTFVGEYDDELVTQAVIREVERGGQVFFLHNRVESIGAKADELRSLMPHVRFLVAHGRMPEKELEEVMAAFLDRQADVLVCTSIIESGLDISAANTLIIDGADALGLAQLYQIRGRIGRSDVNAHAYLLYPPFTTPTRDAIARLSTLSDYTELGSGFRIAMRDLEIRGAGNLLGDEQSGHVAAVGFDMYLDLLRRAVSEFRNELEEEQVAARVDVDVDAYIPEDYIPFEAARIDAHHRIAAARGRQELDHIATELRDRFGPLPPVVENLLAMQEVRLAAGALGAMSLVWRRGRLELAGLKLDSAQRKGLEQTGLRFAYHPLRAILVIWPDDGDAGLPVIQRILDGIIKSLLLKKTG